MPTISTFYGILIQMFTNNKVLDWVWAHYGKNAPDLNEFETIKF